MDLPHVKIQTTYEWQDAPQAIVYHNGRQAGSIKRVRRKKRAKGAKFEKELYICKGYSLAGVNHDRVNGYRYVFGEYSVLKGLDHPNIINYVDFSYNPQSQVAKLYTEYCKDGDLEQLLHQGKKKFSTREGVSILYQISCALLYLHHGVYCAPGGLKLSTSPASTSGEDTASDWNPILHRDIKPANIFVAEYTADCIRVKLGDFGIAKIETDGTDTYIGSRAYQAPEQRMDFQGPGERRTTIRSDIYALGVTMQHTVQPEDSSDSESNEYSGNSDPDDSTDDSIAAFCLHRIIKKCLDTDDRYRPHSGAIIDELRSYVKPANVPRTLLMQVISTTIRSSVQWLGDSGTKAKKAEARSLVLLSQRCLDGGSMLPSVATVRLVESWFKNTKGPDWVNNVLREILALLVNTQGSRLPGMLDELSSSSESLSSLDTVEPMQEGITPTTYAHTNDRDDNVMDNESATKKLRDR